MTTVRTMHAHRALNTDAHIGSLRTDHLNPDAAIGYRSREITAQWCPRLVSQPAAIDQQPSQQVTAAHLGMI